MTTAEPTVFISYVNAHFLQVPTDIFQDFAGFCWMCFTAKKRLLKILASQTFQEEEVQRSMAK